MVVAELAMSLEEHETYQYRDVRGCGAEARKQGTFVHEQGDASRRRGA